MQLLLSTAALLSVASAGFVPADTCTSDQISALTSSACALGVVQTLTVNKVNLATTPYDVTTIMARITNNQTANVTDMFDNYPALVAAIKAFNLTAGTTYLSLPSYSPQQTAYNNMFHDTVCPMMWSTLTTLTTCIPAACNETAWAYCNNATYVGGTKGALSATTIAGYGSQIAGYAVELGALMKIICNNNDLGSTDPSIGVAKCKSIFPAASFGTYVVTTTPAPTANATSSASPVEVAMFAAASMVATAVLAF